MRFFIVVLYLLLSNIGLILIKLGSSNSKFEIKNSILNVSLHYQTTMGFLFYVVGFFLYAYLLGKFNLSYLIPVLTGITFIITILFGVLFLHEKVSFYQMIGIGVLFIGIILMNIK